MNIDSNTPPIIIWQDNNNVYIKPMYIDKKYDGLDTFLALEIRSPRKLTRYMGSGMHDDGRRGNFYNYPKSSKGQWICKNYVPNISNPWCFKNYTFGTVYSVSKSSIYNQRSVKNFCSMVEAIADGEQRPPTPVIIKARAVYRYIETIDNTTYHPRSWSNYMGIDRMGKFGCHDLDQYSNIIEIKLNV